MLDTLVLNIFQCSRIILGNVLKIKGSSSEETKLSTTQRYSILLHGYLLDLHLLVFLLDPTSDPKASSKKFGSNVFMSELSCFILFP